MNEEKDTRFTCTSVPAMNLLVQLAVFNRVKRSHSPIPDNLSISRELDSLEALIIIWSMTMTMTTMFSPSSSITTTILRQCL